MTDQRNTDNSRQYLLEEQLKTLKLAKGFEDFNQFYASQWGDRWPGLLSALIQKPEKTDRLSLFDGNQKIYQMDQGSIWTAQALDVMPGQIVLDMCAAPGGKTLILAENLKSSGVLLANEVSQARRDRLKWVIQNYIPPHQRLTDVDQESSLEDLAAQGLYVRITGKDGGLFAKNPDQFDRILVDAPCSGERYLLENASELKDWKPSRSEFLAQRQYALLTAARIALKSGGSMVYSTCSISKLENDHVVEKLLKKKKDLEVVPMQLPDPRAERTQFGIQIMPDIFSFGPLYYCFLRKR